MKMTAIALVSLFVLAACQKAPNRADTAAKPQDKPAPVNTSTTATLKMDCTSKEVIKTTDKDGVVTHATYEASVKTIDTSELVDEKENLNSYNISGEYVGEFFVTNDKGERVPDGKVDYTYTGTKTSSTEKIDETSYKQKSQKQYTKTGRNGYLFPGPNNTKLESKTIQSESEVSAFDDGSVFYIISFKGTVNGTPVGEQDSYVTNYKSEGQGVTKSVTTLKEARVTENPDGSKVQAESYEETCTETRNSVR